MFSAILLKNPFDQIASRTTLTRGFQFKPVGEVLGDVNAEATSPHNSSGKIQYPRQIKLLLCKMVKTAQHGLSP